jgi:hypothetical protein
LPGKLVRALFCRILDNYCPVSANKPDLVAAHRKNNKNTESFVRMNKSAQGRTALQFAAIGMVFFLSAFTLIEFALLGLGSLTMQTGGKSPTYYVDGGRDSLGSDHCREAIALNIREQTADMFDQDSDGAGGRQGVAAKMTCSWAVVNPLVRVALSKAVIDVPLATRIRRAAPAVTPDDLPVDSSDDSDGYQQLALMEEQPEP